MIDCGPEQIHSQGCDGEAMERIWLASLKLSAGSVAAFENAVLLAQVDWRDVLMGAGFGSDPEAHLRWAALVEG